ncbi:MAG: TonB family protein [Gemmatimonadota bacterium]|nr:TonB family protein [Gemmatimonadota bacterium]
MRLAALALIAVPLCAAAARAQTVSGQVLSLSTRKPLAAVRVALVDDSARIVAAAVTDSLLGAFYVDAPRAGRYRVVLFAPTGGSFLSPAVGVDSGATDERTYSVPELSEAFHGEHFPADVTKQAAIAVGSAGPRYPVGMREMRVRGSVGVAFIVDSRGEPVVSSLQVVISSDEAFTQAVREALPRMRFTAAEVNGQRVGQVMPLTFGFGFPGDQIVGDVTTVAVGVVRSIR